jgi:hypothetical protein
MGALAYSVPVTGGGDVDAARAAIWRSARNAVSQFTGAPAYDEVHEYLDNNDPCAAGAAGPTLSWLFRDLGGLCDRSANAWLHWLGTYVAVEWARVSLLAGEHDVTLAGPRPDVEAAAGGYRFVELRDYLWQVQPGGLFGDERWLDLDELNDTERRRHAEALTACRCIVCVTVL